MSERETLFKARPSFPRERIRAQLHAELAREFDAVMAWEDEMLAFANEAATNVDLLMDASWAAYAATGADTDGDEEWHCTPSEAANSLIRAVSALRADYDDATEFEIEVSPATHALLREIAKIKNCTVNAALEEAIREFGPADVIAAEARALDAVCEDDSENEPPSPRVIGDDFGS